MKIETFKEVKVDLKNAAGKYERAVFVGNSAGVAIRKWCKTCREYMPGKSKGSECSMRKNIYDGRGCCKDWVMHHGYSDLCTPQSKTGKVKSPMYFAYVGRHFNTLLARYAELPLSLREEIGFTQYVRNSYKRDAGHDIYEWYEPSTEICEVFDDEHNGGSNEKV